jgi:hypothetical protein
MYNIAYIRLKLLKIIKNVIVPLYKDSLRKEVGSIFITAEEAFYLEQFLTILGVDTKGAKPGSIDVMIFHPVFELVERTINALEPFIGVAKTDDDCKKRLENNERIAFLTQDF